MNLQNQNFLFDIDNTITRYRMDAIPSGEWLFGNCFLSVIRNILVARNWQKEEAEKAIFDQTNDVIRWDYSEIIRSFDLAWDEVAEAMKKRHEEVLDVYTNTVELIRQVKKSGARIFIVSNNPYWGCRWKLERAGLEADMFEHIFSTDHSGGCKSLEHVWKFIIPRIGAPAERINIVGDDGFEDGNLPLSLGAGRSFILINRGKEIVPSTSPNRILLEDPMQIPDYFKNRNI